MAEPKAEKAPKTKNSAKPDFATLGGIVLALGGIIGGLLMEGGRIKDVAQVTSALIVLGGTIGAVMITTPLPVLIRAAKQLGTLFFAKTESVSAKVEEIIDFATQARKNGIVSLESRAAAVHDPFLKKALELAVDGIEPDKIRDIMECEIAVFEQNAEAESKVFEAAGGYAPTIGIIGAVMGLIQVMQHLADIEEVGRGIAVAFVATIYGVASANLFFLPAAAKLKARSHEVVRVRELMLEGILAIAEGINQKLIKIKLDAYLEKNPGSQKAKKSKAPAGKPAAAEA
ncbi:MAG TPA: flagellar motor protein [Bryobacteraceae bacterium]|jgi:chemotaxis protein MotA